ncbi:hypothetical protein RHMOL_Rhmol07G0158800 [Rhododendron molle]|uniref:Uncharacterized protein n=1 Tax=Rhododendron molle TaxID=49168 RepID=A0ACC0N1B5_RHOML|nr:hypothetical protein RHMOL_Rhmol07G0158800 [Rhododendron molle]
MNLFRGDSIRGNLRMLAALILVILCSSTRAQISMRANVTVAKDGSGHFTTISAAIEAAPKMSATKFYVAIRAGVYTENVFIGQDKQNIVLIGDGMDTTIISGNRSNATGFRTYETATVGIRGLGFVAQDITFENTAGPSRNQAVALRIEADHSAFYKCRFKGYQDTLYTLKKTQFFRECEIYGTVDFIFGNSAVVFQNCVIYVLKPRDSQKNTITAQKREFRDEKTGIIIQNCTIAAAPNLRRQFLNFKTFLGRPWGVFSRTVIINSFLDSLIDPAGWLEWEGRGPDELDKVFYAEYKNKGPGANIKGRVPWARIINSSTEAAEFTVRNFINGDRWIPSTIPFFPDLM